MRAVNLLPRGEARTASQTQKLAIGVGAGGAALATLVLALLFMSATSKVHDEQGSLQDLEAQLAAIPPPPPGPTPGQTALRSQEKPRVAAVSAALQRRVSWDRVLREISLVLPEDVWLSKLTAKSPLSPAAPPGTTPPGSGAPPSGFTMDGYTYSQDAVARLLSRLQVVPDLTNVQLQHANRVEVEKQWVVQFTIAADIRAPGVTS
jgi:Tfp pilus assembly protein PilN